MLEAGCTACCKPILSDHVIDFNASNGCGGGLKAHKFATEPFDLARGRSALEWIAPTRPSGMTFLYLAAPKMRAKRSKPVASAFLEGVEATNGSA